jgi:hypothetical protein
MLLSFSARTAIFFNSASDLIFLLPGLSSSATSCSRMAMARARAGRRNAPVRPEHREIGLLAVELRQCLGAVGCVDDLDAKPR